MLFGLLLAGINFAAPARAQVSLAPLAGFGGPDGWLTPGENGYSYLGTASLERGIAYGNNHLYLVSRNGGENIRILDKLTGADLGALPLGSGIINGGTLTVSTVGVGQDGAIYVANACNPVNGSTPFRVYRWADESSTPTVAFSSTNLTAGQLGTDFDVIGGGAATRLIAGEYTGGGSGLRNSFALLATTDGLSFAGSLSPFVSTQPTAGDFGLGLTFVDSTHVFGAKKSGAGNNPVRYAVINPSLASVTGQWDFEAGNLNATVGSPLQYRGTTASLTQFGTTTSFGIANIGGQPANVMRFPACSSTQGYRMPHGGSPNASPSGTKVNQYTVIMDILYPSTSTGFRSLWQTETNSTLTTDADFFVNGANALGISGQYQGNLTPNVWHRVAFTVDSTTRELGKYIDGTNVLTGPVGATPLGSNPMQYLPTAEAVADGRWALGPLATLFSDENNETGVGYVNSIQFQDRVLSAAEIAALGGPSAAGIPTTNAVTPPGISRLLATPVQATSSDAPMDYAVVNGFPLLATISLSDSRVRIYDASNPTNLSLLATSSATLSNPNSSDAGSVAWGDQVNNGDGTFTAHLYAMNANNGIQAFTVNVGPCIPTTLTSFSVTGGGNQCGGAVVGLSGSQLGATYLLNTNSVYAGISVAGTGSAISFGNQPVTATYTITASNNIYGCTKAMTGSASVVALTPPTITGGPTPTVLTNYEGGIIAFAISAAGTSLTYQWQRDGTNLVNGGRISGATSAMLTIASANAGDIAGAGHGYVCVVSGICSPPAVSSEATATVIPFVASPETFSGIWSNRYNGTEHADDVATRSVQDASGNLIVTGTSDNYLTGQDMVTSKYSGAGALLWTRRYNSPANRNDVPQGLAVDVNGDIFVSGHSFNGLNNDFYVAKYSAADGTISWQSNYTGFGNSEDTVSAVAVDPAGNALVLGQSAGTNCLVKYSATDGAILWVQRTNGSGNISFNSVAIAMDTNGDAVVTGEAWVASGHYDFYTIKYSGFDGSVLWQRRYDALGKYDAAAALALDAGGNVVVAGRSVASGSASDFLIEKYASADGALIWSHRFYDSASSTRQDRARAVALDADGNVAVTGYVTDSGGRYNYFTLKLTAATGATVWWKRYSGSPDLYDQPYAVTVDSSGNIVVAGYSDASNSRDFYTIKYAAADGTEIWAKRYSGSVLSDATPVGVFADPSGDILMAGSMKPTAIGVADFYAARYASADGALAWEQTFDGSGNLEDTPKCVAIDAAGNVIVAGNSSIPVTGSLDFYTIKYSPAGAVLWGHAYGNTNATSDELISMALDSLGNVIVTGNSGNDYYTAKYAAADSALIWEQRYANPANNIDEPRSLVVDSVGNAIVTGRSYASTTGFDYYTAKYAASDGVLMWEKRYSGVATSQTDEASAIAVDAAGDVYVSGNSYSGTNQDIYTAKYAAVDGSLIWEKRYNGPANNNDYGKALCLDTNGDVVVTGRSSNGSNDDYYTAKYAGSNGALLWEQRFNSGGADTPTAITLDLNGNGLVTGFSQGTYCYTVKYDGASGLPLWEQRLTNANQNFDFPIATDAAGDVIVAAWLYAGGKTDFHTVKLASENGAILASAIYNGPVNGNDQFFSSRALAVGTLGEIVVTGGSDGQTNYAAVGNRDFFTLKYNFSTGVNNRPVVANPISDTSAYYGTGFNFTFAANAFSDPDAGQSLSYSASGLPAGITFTPATRTFSGTPTAAGTNSVTVTAIDNGTPALSTNDVFDLIVAKAPLTVTAFDTNRVYGITNPPLAGSLVGVVNSDNITANFITPATIASPPGTYPITPLWNDPNGRLGNYAVTTNVGTLTILSPPALSFAIGGGSGGLFTLSWPTIPSGFLLEFTDGLTPPIIWHEVTSGIIDNGGIKSYSVTNDAAIPSRLYRLRLP